MSFFERLVQLFRDTLRSENELTKNDIHYWLNMCSDAIKKLNEKIEKPDFTRDKKQKCLRLRRGGNLEAEETEARVECRDVESAFQNRITQGS